MLNQGSCTSSSDIRFRLSRFPALNVVGPQPVILHGAIWPCLCCDKSLCFWQALDCGLDLVHCVLHSLPHALIPIARKLLWHGLLVWAIIAAVNVLQAAQLACCSSSRVLPCIPGLDMSVNGKIPQGSGSLTRLSVSAAALPC